MRHFDFQTRIKSLKKILGLLGLWYPENTRYFWYSLTVILMFNLHIMARTAKVFFVNSLDEFSASGILVIAEIITNVKVYFVLANQGEIEHLFLETKKESFKPKSERQEDLARAVFEIYDLLFLSFRIASVFLYSLWGLYPLLEGIEKRRLPFPAKYPYDSSQAPLYEITYVHQMLSYMVMGQIHIQVDFLTFYIVGVVIAEFEFLCDALRQCSDDFDLVCCIKHHQEILIFFKKVNNMLNTVVFCQFAFSFISACFALFRLTVISAFSAEFNALLMFQMAVLFQLLLHCWWGNEVMLTSEKLPQAAFESNWINSSKTFKSNLVFFLQRSQRPNIIYAINFFQVTLDTFKMIVRHSYSFFAVLRHIQEHDGNAT